MARLSSTPLRRTLGWSWVALLVHGFTLPAAFAEDRNAPMRQAEEEAAKSLVEAIGFGTRLPEGYTLWSIAISKEKFVYGFVANKTLPDGDIVGRVICERRARPDTPGLRTKNLVIRSEPADAEPNLKKVFARTMEAIAAKDGGASEPDRAGSVAPTTAVVSTVGQSQEARDRRRRLWLLKIAATAVLILGALYLTFGPAPAPRTERSSEAPAPPAPPEDTLTKT